MNLDNAQSKLLPSFFLTLISSPDRNSWPQRRTRGHTHAPPKDHLVRLSSPMQCISGARCQEALDSGFCHTRSRRLLRIRSTICFFQERLSSSTAVLFVHALNCYGFAWDRRATAEGWDLNRNFVDFSKPPPPDPEEAAKRGHELIAEYGKCQPSGPSRRSRGVWPVLCILVRCEGRLYHWAKYPARRRCLSGDAVTDKKS